jgi:hypothetical protein
MAWSQLIRFLDENDQVHLGDAVSESAQELKNLLEAGNLTANELLGTDIFDAKPTGKVIQVKKLLGPLTPQDVPIIRCVGLNYAKHSMPSFTVLVLYTNNTSQGNGKDSATTSLNLYKTVSLNHRLEQRYPCSEDCTKGSARL